MKKFTESLTEVCPGVQQEPSASRRFHAILDGTGRKHKFEPGSCEKLLLVIGEEPSTNQSCSKCANC